MNRPFIWRTGGGHTAGEMTRQKDKKITLPKFWKFDYSQLQEIEQQVLENTQEKIFRGKTLKMNTINR